MLCLSTRQVILFGHRIYCELQMQTAFDHKKFSETAKFPNSFSQTEFSDFPESGNPVLTSWKSNVKKPRTLCCWTGFRLRLKYLNDVPFLCSWTRSPSYLISANIPFGQRRNACSTDLQGSACHDRNNWSYTGGQWSTCCLDSDGMPAFSAFKTDCRRHINSRNHMTVPNKQIVQCE